MPDDSVIIACKVEANTGIFGSLEGRVPERDAIGDCTGIGLIQKAVLYGARAGYAVEQATTSRASGAADDERQALRNSSLRVRRRSAMALARSPA